MGRNIKDALQTITRALPTADGTVTSSDFDLGANPGELENVELLIQVPVLNSTQLPSADTLTFTVQSGDSATPSTSTGFVKVLTGTGSSSVATEYRFRFPSTIGRYVNVKAVAAGGTGDISGANITLSLCF